MWIAPAVVSSIPAISFSSVDLPQPDGPDEHHELARADLEAHVVDGARAVLVGLGDPVDANPGHAVGALHDVRVTFLRPERAVHVATEVLGRPDGELLRGDDGDERAEPLRHRLERDPPRAPER